MKLLNDINQQLEEAARTQTKNTEPFGRINFNPVSFSTVHKHLADEINNSNVIKELSDIFKSHFRKEDKQVFRFNQQMSLAVIRYSSESNPRQEIEVRIRSESSEGQKRIKGKLAYNTTYALLEKEIRQVLKRKITTAVKGIIPEQQRPAVTKDSDTYTSSFHIGYIVSFTNASQFKVLKQPKDEIAKEIAYKITALAHASKSSTKQVLTDIISKVEGVSLPAHHLESKPDVKNV